MSATAAILGLGPQVGRGDSIWQRRSARVATLYEDNVARRVGDLLTVVIRETTGIEHNDERALDKSSEMGGLLNFQGESGGGMSLSADIDGQASAKRKFNGKAEFTSERDFTDRITVTVVDTLPNGNLIVAGIRRRIVAGEERGLRISGIVRPRDIGAGNVVESRFIANFQIAYAGKGAESSFTNQGWLSRVANRLWPF